MTNNTNILASDLEPVNLTDLTLLVSGGYIKLSGWGIRHISTGRYMIGNGFKNVKISAPYNLKTKKLISTIISEGLLPGGKWMDV